MNQSFKDIIAKVSIDIRNKTIRANVGYMFAPITESINLVINLDNSKKIPINISDWIEYYESINS